MHNTAFIITRLHTGRGIFRAEGDWNPSRQELVHLASLQMMGSDGWVALDLSDARVVALARELTPELLRHLSP